MVTYHDNGQCIRSGGLALDLADSDGSDYHGGEDKGQVCALEGKLAIARHPRVVSDPGEHYGIATL